MSEKFILNKTVVFDEWLQSLKDPLGLVGIVARLKRAENGNFGDYKLLPNTGGIYEMRIFKGNGYRVYYAQQGEKIYLLLLGGSKDKQQTDINKAAAMWQAIQQELQNE